MVVNKLPITPPSLSLDSNFCLFTQRKLKTRGVLINPITPHPEATSALREKATPTKIAYLDFYFFPNVGMELLHNFNSF